MSTGTAPASVITRAAVPTGSYSTSPTISMPTRTVNTAMMATPVRSSIAARCCGSLSSVVMITMANTMIAPSAKITGTFLGCLLWTNKRAYVIASPHRAVMPRGEGRFAVEGVAGYLNFRFPTKLQRGGMDGRTLCGSLAYRSPGWPTNRIPRGQYRTSPRVTRASQMHSQRPRGFDNPLRGKGDCQRPVGRPALQTVKLLLPPYLIPPLLQLSVHGQFTLPLSKLALKVGTS